MGHIRCVCQVGLQTGRIHMRQDASSPPCCEKYPATVYLHETHLFFEQCMQLTNKTLTVSVTITCIHYLCAAEFNDVIFATTLYSGPYLLEHIFNDNKKKKTSSEFDFKFYMTML